MNTIRSLPAARLAGVGLVVGMMTGCSATLDISRSTDAIAVPTVPGVGSVWVNVTRYLHSGASRKPEELRVVRLLDGRPIVAGETFGYRGEIVEGAYGTVVYTETCAAKVPEELMATPQAPNQCAWHLCYPPEIGRTFTRPMFIFVELYSCEPKKGIYRFTALREGTTIHGPVVIGDALVDFGMFNKVAWQSHVMPGYGEVLGESPGRVTEYSTVKVELMNRKREPAASSTSRSALPARLAEWLDREARQAGDKQRECRIVAYGDSLTEGLGAGKDDAYPSVLSRMIDMEICNFGASGRTTSVAREAISEVLSVQPKVVILILGGNDALRGISAWNTKENIRSIVATLVAAGSLVVLGAVEVSDSSSPNYLASLQGLHSEIANEFPEHVMFVPGATAGVLGNPETTSSDGMHPNAAGYRRLAQNLYDAAFAGVMDILKTVPRIPAN